MGTQSEITPNPVSPSLASPCYHAEGLAHDDEKAAGDKHRRRLKYTCHYVSPLGTASASAATFFGTFVFNQHPDVRFHKVLCHWCAPNMLPRALSCGRASLEDRGPRHEPDSTRAAVSRCGVPSALIRSCHDTGHAWHTQTF